MELYEVFVRVPTLVKVNSLDAHDTLIARRLVLLVFSVWKFGKAGKIVVDVRIDGEI
jgi:hypothetical protein